jgi:hypothetical protein
VGLLAPAASGRALVGPGEAHRLADLDGPSIAAFLAGEAPPPALAEALRVDAALAVTRSADIVGRLEAVVPRLLTRDPTPPAGVLASRWLAEPLRELGVDPEPDPPPLRFTREEEEASAAICSALGPGFLALHPGSGSPAKNWPVDCFAEIVRARAGDGPWLLVRGPADHAVARPLSDLPGALLAADLPIRVLGALLSQAGLYIGNDSGITHLAAASGAPTVALFGPTDPATWSPVGPRVEVVESPDGTMEGIALGKAREAMARLEGQ